MSSLSNRKPVPGQRVLVSVAEPWDFESEAGPNRLEARVVSVEPRDGRNACWVLEGDVLLEIGGVSGRSLVMRPRHREQSLDALLDGEKVRVNLGLLSEDEHWASPLSEAKFIIVGSAELAPAMEE